MKLRVSQEAEEEARETARWYNQRSPGRGDEFLVFLEEAYREIENVPSRFPLEESIRTKRPLRFCILRKFPFRVIFETRAADVLVVAVAHGSRRPGYWRRRLR